MRKPQSAQIGEKKNSGYYAVHSELLFPPEGTQYLQKCCECLCWHSLKLCLSFWCSLWQQLSLCQHCEWPWESWQVFYFVFGCCCLYPGGKNALQLLFRVRIFYCWCRRDAADWWQQQGKEETSPLFTWDLCNGNMRAF